MESSSAESDGQILREEQKLYAVDSLNNLNGQNLCLEGPQYPRRYTVDRLPYISQAVWDANSGNAVCMTTQHSMRCQSWYFVTLIITLIVSLVLVSFVIILIVHTGDKIDEVSRKIVLERKSIEDLKTFNNMILQYFNQTEVMENAENFSTMETRQSSHALPCSMCI